jgi:uncharacterized protein (TIGR02147 family)
MIRPLIYNFSDYRQFLKKFFDYKKETVPSFSYRNFSRLAGFSSPNFLKLVIDGQRNLTNTSIAKIARGFKLKKPEREYLENLVYMNQATDHQERDHYYKKIISMKTPKEMKQLQSDQYDYFSKWYLPVLRELVMFDGKQLSAQTLAEKLSPKIKKKDVMTALAQLENLGLIRKDKNGYWEQPEPIITTGPEVKSLLITNFHHEMIKMADESIDRFSADKRDVTAVTLSIDKNNIPEIKSKIAEFRKKILKEYACDQTPDQVIQINIQMFPLTNTDDKGDV